MKKEDATGPDRVDLMLAYLCIKDIGSLPEKVAILDRFRFASGQIASICGVAEQSVINARSKKKKGGSKGRRQSPSTKEV